MLIVINIYEGAPCFSKDKDLQNHDLIQWV